MIKIIYKSGTVKELNKDQEHMFTHHVLPGIISRKGVVYTNFLRGEIDKVYSNGTLIVDRKDFEVVP